MAAIRGGFNFPGLPSETWSAQTPTGTIFDAFKKIDNRLKNMVMAGVYDMSNAAEELANIGKRAILASISKPGSYKAYYKKGKQRMSSQPGQPPAAEQGQDLEPSIYAKSTSKKKDNPASAEFGSTAPFAKDLEFGTAQLQPRPFVLPARQQVANVANAIVARRLMVAYNAKLKSMGVENIVVKMGM